jgi:hypothetical protein
MISSDSYPTKVIKNRSRRDACGTMENIDVEKTEVGTDVDTFSLRLRRTGRKGCGKMNHERHENHEPILKETKF